MPPLDFLASPAAIAASAQVAARLFGLVLIAPVFSNRTIPVRVRTALVLLLTVLLQPVAVVHAGSVPRATPAVLFLEVLVGMAIGLGAALFVHAAEMAGDLLSLQIGLSGAALMDPTNGQSVPVLGRLVGLTATTLLLASDAHVLMLRAVAESLWLVPLGGALAAGEGAAAMVATGGHLFALGIQFSAPVVATVLVANVALAVLSRAASQLNVLSVAFPLQIGVGLLALGTALPLLATSFTGWDLRFEEIAGGLLRAFLSAGG